MSETIRWGIIGTGSIAHNFAKGLSALHDARVVAVASRSREAADKFGEEFSVTHRHIGAAELAANGDVDAVYVATPHPMHKNATLQCLEGGKAVLCEKPFAMNVSEATEMIGTARAKGVFLMEAMWTHFFPAMAETRKIIASGAIGEVRLVQSSFCFRAGWDPKNRLLSPELGGGALLDVGIYNVSLARMVFQRDPSRISSMVHLGETGVDEQCSVLLGYDDGAIATSTSAIRTNTSHDAAIYGADGHIKIPHMFWQPDRIIVKAGQADEEEISFERVGNGYNYEAEEVANCLRNGYLESSVVSLDTTLANMKTMDSIRAQWGLVYPMERKQ
ncbi:MAG: Gfo/Idh/MocA family oxidoreductase [Lentisphaerales bacterium]|jgi:predicted dehydrogenase|nr:MAG: Gfo/Idh/MocA family oxidoreductase [Lentisphaerales bacterium]